MKYAFGSVWNDYLVRNNTEFCARVNNKSVIEVGLCTCELCSNFFDYQIAFPLYYRYFCLNKYGNYCSCFEASRMSYSMELEFQNHTICTECKYDSHCLLFNPHSKCLSSSGYKIGNPFSTSPTSYGFVSYTRDKGRVTDGVIKRDSCDCESSRPNYFDTSNSQTQYNVFPRRQISGNLEDCIDCLEHAYKLEADCYKVCGTGVAVKALTYTSGVLCNTCILSGEPFQELESSDQQKILDCFTEAKIKQKDPLYECRENIIPSLDYSSIVL